MQITKTGDYKPTLLMEELLTEFPEWLVNNPEPGRPDNKRSLLTIEWREAGNKTEVTLTFPDGTDPDRVDVVLDAHDKAQDDGAEKKEKVRKGAKDKVKQSANLTDEEADALFG